MIPQANERWTASEKNRAFEEVPRSPHRVPSIVMRWAEARTKPRQSDSTSAGCRIATPAQRRATAAVGDRGAARIMRASRGRGDADPIG